MTYEVYSTVPFPRKVGIILKNGVFINLQGMNMGKVYSDGTILGPNQETLGRVTLNGRFSNKTIDNFIKMDLKGNIFLKKTRIGDNWDNCQQIPVTG